VLPIVIWIMRDQFNAIPVELDEAAFVTACRSGAPSFASYCRSPFPAWSPRSSCRWCVLEQYFFARCLTSTDAKTPARDGGEPNRLARHPRRQAVHEGGFIKLDRDRVELVAHIQMTIGSTGQV